MLLNTIYIYHKIYEHVRRNENRFNHPKLITLLEYVMDNVSHNTISSSIMCSLCESQAICDDVLVVVDEEVTDDRAHGRGNYFLNWFLRWLLTREKVILTSQVIDIYNNIGLSLRVSRVHVQIGKRLEGRSTDKILRPNSPTVKRGFLLPVSEGICLAPISSCVLNMFLSVMVIEELTSLWKITCPIVITSLLFYSKSVISMFFLGRLGDIELAAGSLSIAFANITGYSVLKGLATAMEPICCQAYGTKKWTILSQTYRKTLCILLLIAVPISLLWLNMEPILLWLGQDQSITSVARVYITYSIPELLAQAHLQPLRTFLRTQNINRPLTISATCAMILHLPINYFLAIYLKLGVKGVALASALNSLNINLGLIVYLILSKTALKPWDGAVTNTCSEGWRPLLALAGPSVLSVCLEWWWYEIIMLLCGLLSNPQASVAAMGILIQTTSLLYAFASSLSSGLSTLVGHWLGADQPAQAQQTTFIGLIVAVVWGFLAFAFTIAVKDLWGKLYTGDPCILALTSIALPILGFCELGNCPQTAACGILIGSARPKMGCYINFGSFYLIGLPVAALLGFKFKMGFVGLWFGLAAAQASCMCMMMYTLIHTDWKHQAKRAKELTQATEDQKNDLEANLLN